MNAGLLDYKQDRFLETRKKKEIFSSLYKFFFFRQKCIHSQSCLIPLSRRFNYRTLLIIPATTQHSADPLSFNSQGNKTANGIIRKKIITESVTERSGHRLHIFELFL